MIKKNAGITVGMAAAVIQLVLSWLLLNIPFNVFPQAGDAAYPEKDIRFEHISLEQGLSQGTVLCILQDRKGFLWFGTEDGLNKYNGYEFKTYRSEPGNPNSLSDSAVWTLIQDRAGILWIGTFGGGLNKFDPKKEVFTHYQADPDCPECLSGNDVRTIYEDRSGMLWIGTFGGGLDKFDPGKEVFTHYKAVPGNSAGLSSNDIKAIHQDRSGILWIGTIGGGLNRFDPKKAKFSCYETDPAVPQGLSSNVVRVIYEDRYGVLWIGTDRGLNKFNREEGTFIRFLPNPLDPASLSGSVVRSIYEDRLGVLWIGTDKGLNVFNREKEKFIRYLADPTDPGSLSSHSIQPIFQDRSGVLWIGTENRGLNKFTREKHRFSVYRRDPNNPNSLSNNTVLSLCEDRAGILWIGTRGGLNRLDREKGIFTHYQGDPNDPHSLNDNHVWAIHEDREGELWIGTFGGLHRLDREKEKFSRYPLDPGMSVVLNKDKISSIAQDQRGFLWIGTGGGLNKFDSKTLTFTCYENDAANPNSLSSNLVSTVYEDRSGILWVGTAEGLNKFNPAKEEFVRYLADPGNPGKLSNDKIITIYEDRAGTPWIGTFGGLHEYHREKDAFSHYSTREGLPNDMIHGILEDEEGNLWLSTNKGLSRFNPGTGEFINYDTRDGLQSNEFKYGACHRGKSGEMFFGGLNGFNAFSPRNIRNNPHKPKIVITDLKIFNKSVRIGEEMDGLTILRNDICETAEIELSYKHTVFSFEYAGLHYVVPGKNKYAYKMEGLEKDWNYVNNRRFATYAHLDPGKYVFRVNGANNDGLWSDEGAAIKITVHPPPWRTWWAYSLYILALAAVVFAYVRSQRKKLAYARAVNRRLRQVDRLKDEFLANTSHELRTPLNGIIGIAESLMKGAAGPLSEKTLANLQMVSLSGRRLSNLVNDILDYSRLKERDLQLHLKPVDMKSLTEVVLLMSGPLIAAKPLQFKNEIGSDIPLVYGDENRLQQIMHNIIGNAVKFTDSGFVSVSARETGTGMVTITVADTGIGIPADKLDDIFKTFEQVDASTAREYGGTGLGLSVTRQLVELHSGSIHVESEVGQGSTFRFTLPVWREDFQTAPPPVSQPPAAGTPAYEIIPPDHDDRPGKIEPGPDSDTTGETYRILAVDDEMINLQVLVNHLSLHNFSVIKAFNGKEALEIIRTPGAGERVDIVLLDVMMPRMSGYEVCREIRKHYTSSELPVIMLTAKTQAENVVEGLDSGANDYITKPFSSEELLERIDVHLQLLKANRDLKGANDKLEDYNRTLEQKVKERTRDLREKNRLIMDSITIARRIQQSILPAEDKIKAALPEHFILFKPKDIVSGDFYWFEQVENKIFIAAVDCTGHGVPGALMSMVGDTILSKLVTEQRVYEPALILEHLHKDVGAALKQKGMRHIDTAGMDVCLCVIEKGGVLSFAGAHLSLYVVKKGAGDMLEIKGDRKSIGGLRKGSEAGRRFTGKKIVLEKGDMIYLASDGFAHQNNGKDKKYGRKRLKQCLLDMAALGMEKQRKKLQKELEKHMGKEEQRDDITIVGIRIC